MREARRCGQTGGVRRAGGWVVLALLALVIGAVLLVAPIVATESCTDGATGSVSCTQGRTSLLSWQGPGVLVPLMVPVLACLLPVVVRTRLAGWLVAVGLLVFCLPGGFSIGLFYPPIAVVPFVLAYRAGSLAVRDEARA